MNPYEVLGVSPLASGEEIRRFFNAKAKTAYDKWVTEKSEKNKIQLDEILDAYIYLNDICIDKKFKLCDNEEEYYLYLEMRKQLMYATMDVYKKSKKMVRRKENYALLKNYIVSFLLIIGGVMGSLASYQTALELRQSRFFVLYGAVISGIVLLIKTYLAHRDIKGSIFRDIRCWIELR